jgi:hypothetical protein
MHEPMCLTLSFRTWTVTYTGLNLFYFWQNPQVVNSIRLRSLQTISKCIEARAGTEMAERRMAVNIKLSLRLCIFHENEKYVTDPIKSSLTYHLVSVRQSPEDYYIII